MATDEPAEYLVAAVIVFALGAAVGAGWSIAADSGTTSSRRPHRLDDDDTDWEKGL